MLRTSSDEVSESRLRPLPEEASQPVSDQLHPVANPGSLQAVEGPHQQNPVKLSRQRAGGRAQETHTLGISSVCTHISLAFPNCSGRVPPAVAELVQAQSFIAASNNLLLLGEMNRGAQRDLIKKSNRRHEHQDCAPTLPGPWGSLPLTYT